MHSKYIFKAIGLSLMAALGLMAFIASSASAENLTLASLKHGTILVLGNEDTKAEVSGTLGLGQLLVPSLGVEIHCEKGSVVSASLINPLGGEALGSFLFENCKLFPIDLTGKLTSTEPLPCVISNGGANHHITATVTILVITHEGVLYLVADPDPLTSPFTEIKYESGKGCPIPLTQKITGTYAFEVTQAHEKVLTITAGLKPLQELLGTKLLYGTNEGIIHGSGTAFLIGASKECTWGVV